MLGEPEYNMNELFAQLGLDSSDEAIDSFIEKNQEEWNKDAAWVEVIDDLNVRMHPDS